LTYLYFTDIIVLAQGYSCPTTGCKVRDLFEKMKDEFSPAQLAEHAHTEFEIWADHDDGEETPAVSFGDCGCSLCHFLKLTNFSSFLGSQEITPLSHASYPTN
jgi:hypothetical protein